MAQQTTAWPCPYGAGRVWQQCQFPDAPQGSWHRLQQLEAAHTADGEQGLREASVALRLDIYKLMPQHPACTPGTWPCHTPGCSMPRSSVPCSALMPCSHAGQVGAGHALPLLSFPRSIQSWEAGALSPSYRTCTVLSSRESSPTSVLVPLPCPTCACTS